MKNIIRHFLLIFMIISIKWVSLFVSCEINTKYLYEGPKPKGELPSAEVFLMNSSSYVREVQRKLEKFQTARSATRRRIESLRV